jgi:hypothetical protein
VFHHTNLLRPRRSNSRRSRGPTPLGKPVLCSSKALVQERQDGEVVDDTGIG